MIIVLRKTGYILHLRRNNFDAIYATYEPEYGLPVINLNLSKMREWSYYHFLTLIISLTSKVKRSPQEIAQIVDREYAVRISLLPEFVLLLVATLSCLFIVHLFPWVVIEATTALFFALMKFFFAINSPKIEN